MAAFVLFVLAVAGGVTVADLAWENPALGQDWDPPGRGQPGAPALAVRVEVRCGKEQLTTHWSPAA
jgi:hypothetical protein